MKIGFHGADRGVTGSCHFIECAGTRLLIDCGLYQGGRELDEENAGAFGFEAGDIDFVLLSHAHLDHCGRLPLLVKRGFQGQIVTTGASRELLGLVLLDAAHLHEEEARRRTRHSARKDIDDRAAPLYTIVDALHTMDFMGATASYGAALHLAPGVTVTFLDAGHILGSASILLELSEGGTQRRVLFSGDLGNVGRPLLLPAPPPPEVDIVVMESTYGNRLHKVIAASTEELYQAVTEAFGRGGNIILPSFALERTQELLFVLRTGLESGRLPPAMQVFLDSPMAISATEIFARYPECYQSEAREAFRRGRDPFALPGLHLTRETNESVALNRITGGAMIIAGSGMCTGGRVRHHLRHNLSRHNCAVIFVGYAGRGTLARRIIDGAQSVTLFGEEVPVRARIYTINGFSAHADQAELLRWHAATHARRTFLVHGEPDVIESLAARLTDTDVETPLLHQQYAL